MTYDLCLIGQAFLINPNPIGNIPSNLFGENNRVYACDTSNQSGCEHRLVIPQIDWAEETNDLMSFL